MTDEIEVLMRPYDGAVPGASLLVVREGVPVIRRAWGLSNLEDRVAATPATNYRLASVTKQFTAAAILLLAEGGKLSLGDRVGRWLPSLPAATGTVTIRHLLTHTSGIVDYEDVIPVGATVQLRDADVLRLLESEDSTYFVPGTNYQYSNSGYALLALIVERASGQSFASFLNLRSHRTLRRTMRAHDTASAGASPERWSGTPGRRVDSGMSSCASQRDGSPS